MIWERGHKKIMNPYTATEDVFKMGVCVCVCVCEREREREREMMLHLFSQVCFEMVAFNSEIEINGVGFGLEAANSICYPMKPSGL